MQALVNILQPKRRKERKKQQNGINASFQERLWQVPVVALYKKNWKES